MKTDFRILKCHLPLLLILLVAMVILYISPYNASDLSISPDSVEYAIGAHNYAYKGICRISYCNEWFPIRYSPWFSMFMLAPVFYFLGGEVGNAVIPIYLLGLSGVCAAYFIGFMISNRTGGVVAALLMLSLPVYQFYSKVIMTDIPATVFILWASLIYMKIVADKNFSVCYFLIAGFLSAFCGGLRPLTYVLILPFLVVIICSGLSSVGKFIRIMLLSIPSLVVIAATFIYNSFTFGSYMRSGYNFWCPIPYDYPNLILSFSNILKNLPILFFSPLPFLFFIFTASFLIRKKISSKNNITDKGGILLIFTLFISIPILCFHLLYFYPEERFYLPLLAFSVIFTASEISYWIPSRYCRSRKHSLFLVCLLLLLLICKFYLPITRIPLRRIIAEQINVLTPDNSIIISSIDPVYLNFFTRDLERKQRIIIPISRNVEYASKLIAPDKLNKLSPPPESCIDHRNMRLIEAGAREVIPFVANDNLSEIMIWAKQGMPIFVDTSRTTEKDLMLFKYLYAEYFIFQKKSRFLYQIILK